MDSFHLAFAEIMGASYFITCDDKILNKAVKIKTNFRIVDPPLFVREVSL